VSQPVVEAVNLTKTYGDVTAVARLNFSVGEGEIFGFLGPNGAGKTTTILMLMGMSEPTSGIAMVCGFDSIREPIGVKRLAGYLPENVAFYDDLTARENLRYTARLNSLSDKESSGRIDELLERVELLEVANQKVGEFSKGMKQRLGIADVLIKEPRVMFLDEPTAGIDPDGANRILDLIVSLNREWGISIVLSSHLLQQVQRICHRVGILVKGKMVASGTIERLGRKALKRTESAVEVQVSPTTPEIVDSIKHIGGVTGVQRSADLILVDCDRDVRPQIAKAVVESGASLLHMKMQDYGLEEIYMKYFHGG
jgi:ABC-2 type transport system ATP-binding protein